MDKNRPITMIFLILLATNSFATAGFGGGATGGGGFSGTGYGSRSNGASYAYSNTDTPYFEIAIISFVLIAIIAIYISIRKFRNNKMLKQLLVRSEIRDNIWNEENLRIYVTDRFLSIQSAWNALDFDSLQKMLTPILFEEWKIKIQEMNYTSIKNRVEIKAVNEVKIENIKDYLDNEKDEFIAEINYNANDFYTCGNNKYYDVNYVEYWRMLRDGNEWRLSEIQRDGPLTKFTIGLENQILEEIPVPNKR